MSERPAVILDMNELPLSYNQGELHVLFNLLAKIVASPIGGTVHVTPDGEKFYVRHEKGSSYHQDGGPYTATVVYQLSDVSEAELQGGDAQASERVFQVVKVVATQIQSE